MPSGIEELSAIQAGVCQAFDGLTREDILNAITDGVREAFIWIEVHRENG